MTSQSEISLQFKRCPMCRTSWPSRDAFLSDRDVEVVGYQVNFVELEAGYFLFNHCCGDTMAIPVLAFRDLYNGPVFVEHAAGTVECPGHCLREDDLDPCPTHCECTFVRDMLQVVKNWPKPG